MGGRGAASGSKKIAGLEATKDGQTMRWYIDSNGGKNYYRRGFGGNPEPTPMNMNAEQLRKRLESNGATVKVITQAQRSAEEKEYRKGREETERILNQADLQDKVMKAGTRGNRLNNRINRKRR